VSVLAVIDPIHGIGWPLQKSFAFGEEEIRQWGTGRVIRGKTKLATCKEIPR
jgi:hypothetical protein